MILSFSITYKSLNDFLENWSKKYSDPKRDKDKYDRHIGKPLTHQSRKDLFEWKNGSNLSDAKYESVKRNYPLTFQKSLLAKRYLDSTADGGAIWNIFYMHCIDPEIWPIFDQHTYRAMQFMKNGMIEEIPSRKSEIYKLYSEQFIPFVEAIDFDQRKIDKALYTFGQFLKMAHRFR